MVEEPERDVYCANKQFYDIRNCDHIKTRPVVFPTAMKFDSRFSWALTFC